MIREAVAEDGTRMAEINVTGWRFAYRNLISDEYLFKTLDIVKKAEFFRKIAEEKQQGISYVFEDKGIVKGFMTIGPCRDVDKKTSFELWGLYVEPFMTKNGVGSHLIRYCEDKAKELGYKEIVLWVLDGNRIGINFYEKMIKIVVKIFRNQNFNFGIFISKIPRCKTRLYICHVCTSLNST